MPPGCNYEKFLWLLSRKLSPVYNVVSWLYKVLHKILFTHAEFGFDPNVISRYNGAFGFYLPVQCHVRAHAR